MSGRFFLKRGREGSFFCPAAAGKFVGTGTRASPTSTTDSPGEHNSCEQMKKTTRKRKRTMLPKKSCESKRNTARKTSQKKKSKAKKAKVGKRVPAEANSSTIAITNTTESSSPMSHMNLLSVENVQEILSAALNCPGLSQRQFMNVFVQVLPRLRARMQELFSLFWQHLFPILQGKGWVFQSGNDSSHSKFISPKNKLGESVPTTFFAICDVLLFIKESSAIWNMTIFESQCAQVVTDTLLEQRDLVTRCTQALWAGRKI